MLCKWVEPSGLVKATRDCCTLPCQHWVIVLLPQSQGSWVLVGCFCLFPNSPGTLSSPPFPTISPFSEHPEEAVRALPGSRERQAKNVPSGLGAGNQAQHPKTSGAGDTEGSPEALAAEGTYLHCHQAPDDTLSP